MNFCRLLPSGILSVGCISNRLGWKQKAVESVSRDRRTYRSKNWNSPSKEKSAETNAPVRPALSPGKATSVPCKAWWFSSVPCRPSHSSRSPSMSAFCQPTPAVPRCRLKTYACPAFSIAGPTVWNSLPHVLRDPQCGYDSYMYKQFLKTIVFSLY